MNYKKLKMGLHGLPTWDALAYPVLLIINDVGIITRKELQNKAVRVLGIPNELTQVYSDNGTNILLIELVGNIPS